MELGQIYSPVQGDLEALDGRLRAELTSDDPFIGDLVAHVLRTHGKMVRPALVCLSALACAGGERRPPDRVGRLEIAGAVELIHVASLVHDDVIDTADLRRGQATVNSVWGNQVAVLLGDYLFSKAFHMLARLRQADLAAAMAWATVRMSQAEIKQIKYGNTPHTDETIYFDIIEGKTAQLMSAACRCGAMTAGAGEDEAAALAAFGLEWGMAFQITDDALDLTASASSLGKPIGSDIQTGKVTLPIIHALLRAPEADRRHLEAVLTRTNGDAREDPTADVREILARCGAVDYALDVARARADRAAAALGRLRDSPARSSLHGLVEFVTVRTR
ncbi:MAG TPA: polyprenyl synthetase family protein [bacterium]|nr:polyprenyl synthetase family protein [bacterium]